MCSFPERGIYIQNAHTCTQCTYNADAGARHEIVVQMRCVRFANSRGYGVPLLFDHGGEKRRMLSKRDMVSSPRIRDLCVLHNADLGRPQHPSVELEALLLCVEAASILLVWLRRLEHGLVHIGVELLARLGGVEAFQTMLLQGGDQDGVSHLDAVVQGDEIRVIGLELLGSDCAEGTVEVIDRLDEIAGEALDGEVFGGLRLAFRTLLQVAEVGY